ncbi:hypothetical protein XIS1_1040047 [Xenorhabdus innexi]|uniref:Uncharacterized protein n=1 Tax=Xenorhabdus innexi TaxID=290109 RepID=A0A1N6MQL7_9GAMM|nr:hypothetical protein XIS1_1040047 [Xenorhabdus innexi]
MYTQWVSRCIAAARESIPGSIDHYVTGMNERSQQRGSLKDEVYRGRYEKERTDRFIAASGCYLDCFYERYRATRW